MLDKERNPFKMYEYFHEYCEHCNTSNNEKWYCQACKEYENRMRTTNNEGYPPIFFIKKEESD